MTARAVSFSLPLTDKIDELQDLISRIFTDNKTVVESKEQQRNVLAIRNFTPATNDVPRGAFDDMILVSQLGKDGKKSVQYFDANTDPSY